MSDVIDAERRLRRLSVRALALLSSIDRTKAQRLINGGAPWTLTELEDVCSALDLRVSTVVAQAERRQRDTIAAYPPRRLRAATGALGPDPLEEDHDAQIAALDVGREGGAPEPGSP